MFVDRRLAGTPRYYLHPPKDVAMRVPETIRKCVAFLGVPRGDDEGQGIDIRCSAYLVGTPADDETASFCQLVTVKHHADKLVGKRFGMRVNGKGDEAVTVWADERAKWWYHPTNPDGVDVAVLTWAGFGPDVDVRVVPVSMFIPDELVEEGGIGPGDGVFIAGLFTRLRMKRNEPIVRTGNIAALPRERIPNVNVGGTVTDAEMYLIEVRSMGGLSGSPVFVRETVSVPLQREAWFPPDGEESKGEGLFYGPFHFLGHMHGHWEIPPDEHNKYDFRTGRRDENEKIALGLSLAVPAKQILEVINQPGLVEFRREYERALWRERGSTTSD